MPRYFTPAVFRFLRDLAENNNKEWWEDNKQTYIETIREPALDFITEFGRRLTSISPYFTADTRTNGGSLMRPYRDMRFSSNKTPYKTNVGIQFRHVRGKDVHAPGFYLHIEPGENFAGAGLWNPETKTARVIRRAINDDPREWQEVAHSRQFGDLWSLPSHETARLKRIPKELDGDHPFADDLRLRSFTAATTLTQNKITSTEFVDHLHGLFTLAGPYTRFLCKATGVDF